MTASMMLDRTDSASMYVPPRSLPAPVAPAGEGGTSRKSGYYVKSATTRREFQAAFNLVYRAYQQKGLVTPNPYQMRILPHHLLSTSDVYIGQNGGELVTTISLIRDSALGLPMEKIFGWEVGECRRIGRTVAEVSCLADRAQLEGKQSLSEVVKVMSLMVQNAIRRGVDDLLIAVHPHHVGFYERFVGFRRIGAEKAYEAVCDNPAVALVLDLNCWSDDYPKGYNRFCGTPFSEEQLQARPMSAQLRAEFSVYLGHHSPARPARLAAA